jgi:hypothetical protein
MKADRDASMDQLLARTLKSRATAANGESCLDVETLAAWADGALDARDRAAAEAHAADCARCQELLAAMVRTLPPMEVAKSPWRIPSLTWLVPLTAAATALAIWVAVPKPHPAQVSDGEATVVDQAEPAPSASRATVPSSSPAAPQAATIVTPGLELQRAKENLELQSAKEKAVTPSAPSPRPTVQERREADSRDKQEASPPAEQKVSGLADTSNAAPAAAAPLRTAAAPPAVDATAPSSARAEMFVAQSRALAAAVPEIIIVSSNPSTRFRLLPNGAVQRSADAGSTWRTEPTGATERLTAGASPSPSVCWLVGNAGTVLRSTDGRSWRRIAFPETVDLRAVAATDQETATVTTADGRAFVTTDGGQTWSLRPGL